MLSRTRMRAGGFTIIEMIVVIVISAILAGIVSRNIGEPVRAFADLERRAELVDIAATAMHRIKRELRLALPNSVRVSPDALSLEFLRTATGGRYRRAADPTDPATDILDFSVETDSFDVLGPLNAFSGVTALGGATTNNCIAGTADCLVIFNSGDPTVCGAPPQSNAYCADNMAAVTVFDSAGQSISFARNPGSGPFPFVSDRQRFHVVDTPVSFVCSGSSLDRYAEYPIAAAQPLPPAVTPQRLAERVTSCAFSYQPGTATGRAGIVTVRLAITDTNLDGQAETVTLLEQIHVRNTP